MAKKQNQGMGAELGKAMGRTRIQDADFAAPKKSKAQVMKEAAEVVGSRGRTTNNGRGGRSVARK